MRKRADVTGQRYGRLQAERFESQGRRRESIWLFRCDCGADHVAPLPDVRRGKVRSCGCLMAELVGQRSRRHGYADTPEYRAYHDAKNRCTNDRNASWGDYGGRGIRFLFSSFAAFYAEVGERPFGMSLDRINNDGNYEPGNVRWTTTREQAKNKRKRRR